MRKHIVGLFQSEADATRVINALAQQHVDTQHISLVAAHHEQQVHGGKPAGTNAGAGLAAVGAATVATMLIPGIGLVVGGPLAAGLMAAAAQDAEHDEQIDHLRELLLRAGLSESQTSSYAEEIRAGRTLIAVEADEEQTDTIADILRSHGGAGLSYRKAK